MSKVRIILTGAAKESREFAVRIRRHGSVVTIVPTIKIRKHALSRRSRAALERSGEYDYVLFTSQHAVQFFVAELRNRWIKLPQRPRILAIGPATAQAASNAGFKARIVSKKPGARELAKQLKNIRGKRILFPRSTIAASDALEILRKKGARVDVVSLYTTNPVSVSKTVLNKLFQKETSAIIFLSPSSIQSFSKHLTGAILRKRALGTRIIAIGPTTATAASKVGFKHVTIAKPSTTDGVIESIRKL